MCVCSFRACRAMRWQPSREGWPTLKPWFASKTSSTDSIRKTSALRSSSPWRAQGESVCCVYCSGFIVHSVCPFFSPGFSACMFGCVRSFRFETKVQVGPRNSAAKGHCNLITNQSLPKNSEANYGQVLYKCLTGYKWK